MAQTYHVEFSDEQARALERIAADRDTTVPDLLRALALMHDESVQDWGPLSDEDVAAIEEGRAQIARGDVVPHDDVMQRAKNLIGRA